jgi:peptide/nickel transport system substrate-binding protein
MDNPNFTTVKAQGLFYYWIGMDVENPKLADINVRQAIRYGIDVDQILAGVYFGQAEREDALVPPGLTGYWKDAPHYQRDVAKAKEYLTKAGKTSLDLTYSCSNTTEAKAQAEIVQQNLAEVGINVTIDSIDASSFWQAGMGDNGKKLELYATGFSMYPDPSWATMWFTCDQVGVWNWMRWCSKDFDKLHMQGVEELDPAKRDEIYIQMQKLWDEACINVWVTHGANIHAYKKNLAPSFTPHGQEQLWYFKAA